MVVLNAQSRDSLLNFRHLGRRELKENISTMFNIKFLLKSSKFEEKNADN